MDKEEILSITQGINSNQLKTEDIVKVIVDYCIEKGKDISISQKFAISLLHSGIIMGYFSTALEYFQKKFNICTIINEKGKVLITF